MALSIRTCTIAFSLIAMTAIPTFLSAQDGGDKSNPQPRYRLIDLGTFGGPNSSIVNGPPLLKALNNSGTVVGTAETATSDPYQPDCISPGCAVTHTFRWQNDALTDLGALPGVNGSIPVWVNELGLIAGASENGSIDPLTGFPETDAVIWRNGTITNLGTFGGSSSLALSVNDWGQVVGGATNDIPDNNSSAQPFLFFPVATQYRAFLWQSGKMRDLGTLGGDDAVAALINDFGQIAGASYTNTTPNPTTGVPTLDPFLWQNGKMFDLGTLGGTSGYPNWLNIWGEVVGQSKLAGDKFVHPFLSRGGRPMTDLGTLGGNTGQAFWINDVGQVVGQADLPGSGTQLHHGFLWQQGRMKDLGTVDGDPCSRALSINLRGHVVGASTNCTEFLHAFLWESGVMYDLNALVPPGSGLTLTVGWDINDRGEITGDAFLANGDEHAFLAVPCEDDDPADCKNTPATVVTTPSNQGSLMRPATSVESGNQVRMRFGRQYNGARVLGAPTN